MADPELPAGLHRVHHSAVVGVQKQDPALSKLQHAGDEQRGQLVHNGELPLLSGPAGNRAQLNGLAAVVFRGLQRPRTASMQINQ